MSIEQTGKFMVTVGCIIEHKQSGEILLLKRNAKADFMPGVWEDITGRLNQFEEPTDGLKREVLEETGLKNIQIVKPIKVFHIFRGAKNAKNELVGIIYWVKTNTKKIILSKEHSRYEWLNPQQAIKITTHPAIKNDIKTFLQERDK